MKESNKALMGSTLHMLKIATALGVLSVVTLSGTAFAAQLTAADRAWTDTCMAQRTASNEQPLRLRKY